ncbi:unnamed protein product [Brassica rapa]|uniref:Uncharacterized protein n=1 Tax=Brassica campestris TaxID=3711 RepID=A0A8D9LRH8_BRACM|nr:unnamed protein product [Brassica rapa]
MVLVYCWLCSYVCAVGDCWRSSTTCYWRFIHPWAIVAIVTGVATLTLKIVFAIVWTFMYNIPVASALGTILTSVSGIAITPRVSSLIDWIVKLFQ